MNYRLAAFEPAHLSDLTDLWIAAWTPAMPAIDFKARRAWFVDHLKAMHARGVEVTCAVDATNGSLVGFITLDHANGHIDQLAVAPEKWGGGAAAALLTHAKRHGPGKLSLEVNQDNPRAVGFYEKHGFRRRGAAVNPNSGLATWRYEWTDLP